jgi:hypothetical protein
MLSWFGKLPPCLLGIEACATAHDWARGSPSSGTRFTDPARLCDGLCPAQQERCDGRGSDLRGGEPSIAGNSRRPGDSASQILCLPARQPSRRRSTRGSEVVPENWTGC